MTIRSISDVLNDLVQNLQGEHMSINDLIESLHERGFGFLLLILALPMAIPLPVPPGINILLASPLIILTAQQAIGRKNIWMPETIRKKSITRRKLETIINASIPWIQRLEIIIKPRLGGITHGYFSNAIGALGFIMALTICIPIPLTNTIPSLGIALMAIGVIMRDGLAVIVGALTGTLWVVMLAYIIIFLGTEGIDIAKETIKSVL
ncbi:MAG: exopolysaccharide biosynthesis protein [Alphaproteobacteria bacterium]|nr:exopolysaccharide biosynthesis protein [Alphaproteobacteria bacterium]